MENRIFDTAPGVVPDGQAMRDGARARERKIAMWRKKKKRSVVRLTWVTINLTNHPACTLPPDGPARSCASPALHVRPPGAAVRLLEAALHGLEGPTTNATRVIHQEPDP